MTELPNPLEISGDFSCETIGFSNNGPVTPVSAEDKNPIEYLVLLINRNLITD